MSKRQVPKYVEFYPYYPPPTWPSAQAEIDRAWKLARETRPDAAEAKTLGYLGHKNGWHYFQVRGEAKPVVIEEQLYSKWSTEEIGQRHGELTLAAEFGVNRHGEPVEKRYNREREASYLEELYRERPDAETLIAFFEAAFEDLLDTGWKWPAPEAA